MNRSVLRNHFQLEIKFCSREERRGHLPSPYCPGRCQSSPDWGLSCNFMLILIPGWTERSTNWRKENPRNGYLRPSGNNSLSFISLNYTHISCPVLSSAFLQWVQKLVFLETPALFSVLNCPNIILFYFSPVPNMTASSSVSGAWKCCNSSQFYWSNPSSERERECLCLSTEKHPMCSHQPPATYTYSIISDHYLKAENTEQTREYFG